MKFRTQPSPLQGAIAMVLLLSFNAAHAATITKSDSGTDLALGASWGGSAPGSADVGTWINTSLGTGLTLDANASWQGISITNATSDIALSGGGALTLGTDGIDMDSATANLSIANNLVMAGTQEWNVATGKTLSVAGVVSGSGTFNINGSTKTFASFLTTTSQTVWAGATLSNLTSVDGFVGGGWIGTPIDGSPFFLSNNGTTATYQLQINDSGYIKCVKVQLDQTGADITGRVLYAEYQGGTSLGYDFDGAGAGTAASVATSSGADGYGAASTTLSTASASLNGMVVLSGVNTFTGPISITGGTLKIDGSGQLGSGAYAGAITNNGAFIYHSSAAQTLSGVISGSGSFTHSGSGTLTLSGVNTYTGATTVNSGTLVLNATAVNTIGTTRSTAITVNAGATLSLAASSQFENYNTAAITLNGGTLTTANNVFNYVKSVTMSNGATWALGSGGYLGTWQNFALTNVTVPVSATGSTISSAGGSIATWTTGITFNVARGSAASDLTVSAPLGQYDGSGGITKTGNGILTLTGTNTYTGATTVTAGTLIVNGSLGNSSTTIDSNGILMGSGTLGGTVAVDGTLAPGGSIGTLTFSQTLTLTNIANFEIDPTLELGLNRASDLANVTGAVTYGGALNVLYGGPNSNFSNGMIFNLFDGSSFSGTFSAINLPDLTGTGLSWQNNLASNGSFAVVPEPSALLLGSIGILALLRRRPGLLHHGHVHPHMDRRARAHQRAGGFVVSGRVAAEAARKSSQ